MTDQQDRDFTLEVTEHREQVGSGRFVAAVIMAMALALVSSSAGLALAVGRFYERQAYNRQIEAFNQQLEEGRVERAELNQRIQVLSGDLNEARSVSDTAVQSDRCMNAFGRAITRATDDINRAESDLLITLLDRDTPAYRAAAQRYGAAARQFSLAVDERDKWVARGSPLPCPKG